MNPWISHVKAYQAKHGCSYKEALQKSRATYKKGSGILDILGKPTMTEQPRAEAWGDRLKRQIKEGKAAAEAERMAERMASMPKPVDTTMYAGMRKGGSLSSANRAYWKMNKDLFNATYPTMSKAAMSLYGF
jgi:hypothetical protein